MVVSYIGLLCIGPNPMLSPKRNRLHRTVKCPVLYHEDVLSLRNDWLLTHEDSSKKSTA
jgi:hypothetical protein